MSRYRTGIRLFAAAGLMATVMAGAVPAHAGPAAVSLSGAEEVPANFSTATGTFTYKIKGDRLCYTLTANSLGGTPTGAHIHDAPAGEVGPIVIPLQVDVTATSFTTDTCVEADKSLLKDIRHDPDAYYVNVHSVVIPSGEIRGQLG